MTAFDEAYPERAPGVLDGLPDLSFGKVTAFFADLAEPDRDLIHHYLEDGIEPQDVASYVYELLQGYIERDPERHAVGAIELAAHELDRLERYLAHFIEAKDGFPSGTVRDMKLVDDETGDEHPYEEAGWIWDYCRGGVYRETLADHQADILDTTLPFLAWARTALTDPAVTVEAAVTQFCKTARIRGFVPSSGRLAAYITDLGVNDTMAPTPTNESQH